jgi:mono/diheme cytochrome c family protein
VGKIFNSITNGIRTMPAYASQIPPRDRWAIVVYVLALQRSQNALLDDLPPDERQQLEMRDFKN